MPESVYKVIELVGSSPESWEKAAAVALKQASQTLDDLRIAEVLQMDVHLKEGGKSGEIEAYRVKLRVSFKYKGHG
jgi:flavin-binding protein dodecin